MKKKILKFYLLTQIGLFGAFELDAHSISLNSRDSLVMTPVILDSVVVSALGLGNKTPMAFTRIHKDELKKEAASKSLPMMLDFQPSVISQSEGGSGLGYSKMSVRGSDGSRINVTLNGIAINDAASQEVFWVNIPALSSFLQSAQLQRGVGSSSNGSGAFGATLNMETLLPSQEAYGLAEMGVGSYQTYTSLVGAGTGLTKSGFFFDARFSHNSTKGYIRNAFADVNSAFMSTGYVKGKNSIRLNYIYGDQISGITWEGISRDMLEKDRRYNPAGEYKDDAGNIKYYDNETDNYKQHHVQAIYAHQFSDKLYWTTTLHFTKGDGFYENYKAGEKFLDYDLKPQVIDGITHENSDFIIKKAMDNQLYSGATTLKYNFKNLRINTGLSYAYYAGDNFGDILWSKYNNNITPDYQFYLNDGKKQDFGVYIRGEYDIIDKLTIFADIQYRHIDFELGGFDDDFIDIDSRSIYNFFNPKGGLTFALNESNKFYGSVAVGRKEPTRSDLKEAIKAGYADRIKEERLIDYEIGYNYTSPKLALMANVYFMEYKDQLVSTGKLTDSGYAIKENVANSYRRGIELGVFWKPISWLNFDANMTLSKNKILNYTAWVDTYVYVSPETWIPLSQTEEFYKDTDILNSPEIIAMARLTFKPCEKTNIAVHGKYIGQQFFDNTSSADRSLPAYFVMGINASRVFKLKNGSGFTVSLFVDNLLNKKYVSGAWVYRALFEDGSDPYIEEGFYPQAEINFTAKIAYNF